MAYTTIDDPSAYFNTLLYSGNAGTNALTNSANAGNFQPDWLWIRCRNSDVSHNVFDTSRQTSGESTLVIRPNSTDAESNVSGDGMTSIDSNGFTLNGGGSGGGVNESGKTYVAWQWKANGGTTTSFSASSAQLAGTRQSNTTAGFSIITYTGDGNNNATIPHGLNSAPKWVVIKERGNATNWYVGHDATFTTGEKFLNLENATAAAFGPFNKTAPTASNIVLGTDGSVNGSSDTYVCYAFAEVQGYSKFGSYEGNGNADGAFVYTGFKPAFVIVKRTDSANHWIILDSSRTDSSGGNSIDRWIRVNTDAAEVNGSGVDFDFVSNGFKLRSADNMTNNSSGSYIYMAFAEHPFVSSEGVPVTAR